MAAASVLCCDTSFLFSLYGSDVNTPAALESVANLGRPIIFSPFNLFELENAFRFAEFRRKLAPGKAAIYLAAFWADRMAGRMLPGRCDLAAVVEEARRLSEAHTLTGGHRGFDVLHVAASRVLRAGEFLSFDGNQRALAEAEGLTVGP